MGNSVSSANFNPTTSLHSLIVAFLGHVMSVRRNLIMNLETSGLLERKHIRWHSGVCYCIVWYLPEEYIAKYRDNVRQLSNFASLQLLINIRTH
jgi:hypothetical protein